MDVVPAVAGGDGLTTKGGTRRLGVVHATSRRCTAAGQGALGRAEDAAAAAGKADHTGRRRSRPGRGVADRDRALVANRQHLRTAQGRGCGAQRDGDGDLAAAGDMAAVTAVAGSYRVGTRAYWSRRVADRA